MPLPRSDAADRESDCESTAASAANVQRLRSKLRALGRSRGGPDFFPRLLRQFEKQGRLDWPAFHDALRKGGRFSRRECSDRDLRAAFDAVDSDHDGLIDTDEIAMWFAVSRTQRVALPVLVKKKPKGLDNADGLSVEDDVARMAREVEEGLAILDQEANPPGLTKFWYKQHTAYRTRVARGEEHRFLLPYNLPREQVLRRYEDILDEEETAASPHRASHLKSGLGGSGGLDATGTPGRSIEWLMHKLFEKCGFSVTAQQVRDILGRFYINPDDTNPDHHHPEAKQIKTLFSEAFIDSSARGWKYQFRPLPPPPTQEPIRYDNPGTPLEKRLQSRNPDEEQHSFKTIRAKAKSGDGFIRPGHPSFSGFKSTSRRWDQDVAQGKLRKGDGAAWYSFARGDFDSKSGRASCTNHMRSKSHILDRGSRTAGSTSHVRSKSNVQRIYPRRKPRKLQSISHNHSKQ